MSAWAVIVYVAIAALVYQISADNCRAAGRRVHVPAFVTCSLLWPLSVPVAACVAVWRVRRARRGR